MQIGYDYKALVDVLRSYDSEEDWFEFKVNNSDPQRIGEYISALSNSAALGNHPYAYLVWGVDDATHKVVGTAFKPFEAKKGDQDLSVWLAAKTSPRLAVGFVELEVDDKHVVLLEIPAASSSPVRFDREAYIRIGSHNQRLSDYPEMERELWRHFDRNPGEKRVVQEGLSSSAIVELIATEAYFVVQGLPIPSSADLQLEKLLDEDFIRKDDNGTFSITVLGALLFARNLSAFPSLASKALRIIRYSGTGRVEASNDVTLMQGYAISFENACATVNGFISSTEEIGGGLRKDRKAYPESAIREVIANIIIHQDLTAAGSGPVVEVFSDRVEGTNPGSLLVPLARIIDAPPHARNEAMAAFLRRIRVCEERGSGFDRMEAGMESHHLPSPIVETDTGFTRIRLWGLDDLRDWPKDVRIWTCYISTCLKYIESVPVSNSVIRERLGISASNSAVVSRLLGEAIEKGYIKIEDESKGAKARRYLPFWA